MIELLVLGGVLALSAGALSSKPKPKNDLFEIASKGAVKYYPRQEHKERFGPVKPLEEGQVIVGKMHVNDIMGSTIGFEGELELYEQCVKDMGYKIIRTQYVDNHIGPSLVHGSVPMFDPYVEFVCEK